MTMFINFLRKIQMMFQDFNDSKKLGMAMEQIQDWIKDNPDATDEQKIAAAARIHAKYGGLYIRSYPGGPRRLMTPENRELAIAERRAYEEAKKAKKM